jgi:hypothetical protein
MWRELLTELSPGIKLVAPCSKKELARVQTVLGVALPKQLAKFLLETNGARGADGSGLVWSLDSIVQENLELRSNDEFKELFMSFDSLLFFADAGNGDQFAFAIHGSSINTPDIYVWNHEDDSRSWVAASFEMYLRGWLSGEIKI